MTGFDRTVINNAYAFLNGGQHTLRTTAISQFILQRLVVGMLHKLPFFFRIHAGLQNSMRQP